MAMKSLKFKKSNFDGMPEESVVLKFPEMTLTVFKGGKKVYAEILKGKHRTTFEGEVDDPEADIRASVEKVMAKLNQVVQITKMDK